MECGNQISDAVPLSMACSMACRFHAIDARLPPFLRLLDGVQVNLTHFLIFTQVEAVEERVIGEDAHGRLDYQKA